jgi:hypothetical protein
MPISLGWKEDLLTDQSDEELASNVSKGQHLNKKGNIYEVQLHGGSVVEDVNLGNPLKLKRTREAPTTKTDDFL